MAEALDNLNFMRMFWELLFVNQSSHKLDQDGVLKQAPESCLITDCKGLFDAVNRNQSAGLGLSEKRTAIECLSIRQITAESNVTVKWVNSDRQVADILTKQGVMTENIDRVLRGTWKIVFDETFTSAKNLRKQNREGRSGHFKKLQNKSQKNAPNSQDESAAFLERLDSFRNDYPDQYSAMMTKLRDKFPGTIPSCF